MTENVNIKDSTVNDAGENIYNIIRDNVQVNVRELRHVTNIILVLPSPKSASPSRSMWAGIVTLGGLNYADIKSVMMVTFRKLGESISSRVVFVLTAAQPFLR
jgi:hypothetical protein